MPTRVRRRHRDPQRTTGAYAGDFIQQPLPCPNHALTSHVGAFNPRRSIYAVRCRSTSHRRPSTEVAGRSSRQSALGYRPWQSAGRPRLAQRRSISLTARHRRRVRWSQWTAAKAAAAAILYGCLKRCYVDIGHCEGCLWRTLHASN